MAKTSSRSQAASGSEPTDALETPPAVEPAQESSQGAASAPPPPWFDLFGLDRESAKDEEIQAVVNRDIAALVSADASSGEYNVRFLYDSRSIGRNDADRIYRSLRNVDHARPILLVIKSPGGSISAAYFVAKVCRENTNTEFVVAVPREAKSAATLICCGADRIHMGSLSELGPVDPQFGAIPALALKHSIEHLAELAAQHPAAATMLTDYLARTLRIEALGYYERVAASAVQYAVRLLNSRTTKRQPSDEVEQIANHLVYSYKDHGFVIDSREATQIFGHDVISCNTPEYELANKVYGRLDLVEYIVQTTFGREIAFTGSADDGAVVFRPRPSE